MGGTPNPPHLNPPPRWGEEDYHPPPPYAVFVTPFGDFSCPRTKVFTGWRERADEGILAGGEIQGREFSFAARKGDMYARGWRSVRPEITSAATVPVVRRPTLRVPLS